MQDAPIECIDLEGLVSIISDWMDVNESTILERLEDGEITGDDGEVYKIVRLRIETWDLDPDDESEIKRVAEGYEKLAAEMRQRYGGSDK